MGSVNDKVLCCAIARSFREYATAEQLRRPVSELLSDDNWMCRRSGAFVAGFLEHGTVADDLQRVAYSDPRWDVCSIAQRAIRSHQREAEAARLVATMDLDEPANIWGTIDSIVQLTDPAVLVLSADPIGFLDRLRAQPFAIRRYASGAIKKRREQLEKDMTSLHGKWKDD
jgi:hypothetical protein